MELTITMVTNIYKPLIKSHMIHGTIVYLYLHLPVTTSHQKIQPFMYLGKSTMPSSMDPSVMGIPGSRILQVSGQIIATSHDLTPNGGLAREIPLFQGNLGW